jgi:2-amino-4-hydroxy-6-hydroxymethyldihydropteridine diphosphokinase
MRPPLAICRRMVQHLVMPAALISIGSNLGNRQSAIDNAIAQLRTHAHIQNVVLSSLHESEAIGGPTGQDVFLNSAALLKTTLPAAELLGVLQQIENDSKRTREIRWAARTLDLDIALYDDQIVESDSLTIPHPRMVSRKFILQPAVEIAANMVNPQTGWTLEDHLLHLNQAAREYILITASEDEKLRLEQAVTNHPIVENCQLTFAVAQPDFMVNEIPASTRLAIIVSQEARQLCSPITDVPCSLPWIYVTNSTASVDEILAAILASQ